MPRRISQNIFGWTFRVPLAPSSPSLSSSPSSTSSSPSICDDFSCPFDSFSGCKWRYKQMRLKLDEVSLNRPSVDIATTTKTPAVSQCNGASWRISNGIIAGDNNDDGDADSNCFCYEDVSKLYHFKKKNHNRPMPMIWTKEEDIALANEVNDIADEDDTRLLLCGWVNCGRRFDNWFKLQRHQFYHNRKSRNEKKQLKPYPCDWPDCFVRYKKLKNLIVHRRIHTGERPFKCESCSKSFRASHSLSNHRKTHSKVRSSDNRKTSIDKLVTKEVSKTSLTRTMPATRSRRSSTVSR